MANASFHDYYQKLSRAIERTKKTAGWAEYVYSRGEIAQKRRYVSLWGFRTERPAWSHSISRSGLQLICLAFVLHQSSQFYLLPNIADLSEIWFVMGCLETCISSSPLLGYDEADNTHQTYGGRRLDPTSTLIAKREWSRKHHASVEFGIYMRHGIRNPRVSRQRL